MTNPSAIAENWHYMADIEVAGSEPETLADTVVPGSTDNMAGLVHYSQQQTDHCFSSTIRCSMDCFCSLFWFLVRLKPKYYNICCYYYQALWQI